MLRQEIQILRVLQEAGDELLWFTCGRGCGKLLMADSDGGTIEDGAGYSCRVSAGMRALAGW